MGEILGIGCPHGPHLKLTDETMANCYFRVNLKNEKTPAFLKDPKNWPSELRAEWGDDEGLAAARRHREESLRGFRAARQALDAFHPDFVVIFGDDQYENFKEEVLPPFCVYALEEIDFGGKPKGGLAPGGVSIGTFLERPPLPKIKGNKRSATFLAAELVKRGFDVPWAAKLREGQGLGHAFSYTLDYLDWDRKGFPYPVIPFHVNCYGEDLRMPHPGVGMSMGRLHENIPDDVVLPPPAPLPWRCYDLGKALAQVITESPYRAAIIGSSSWSHASLTAMHGFLWGDVDRDRQLREELKSGRQDRWRDLDWKQLRASGQHEMLNWICLAGAMEGRKAEILAYAETYIFNSSKCVALFPAGKG